MPWTREELKMRGKMAMHRSYWKAVLASLLLMLAGGAGGSAGSVMGRLGGSGVNSSSDYTTLGEYGSIADSGLLALLLSVGLLVVLISAAVGIAVSFFLLNPLEVGAQRFFIVNRVQDTELREIGFPFGHGYMNVVCVQFFRWLYTFLWSLLFVIPGIIKGYEYRMIPYILAENPEIERQEAFRISKAMMDGEKMNAFVLDLSFIGWHLLSLLTCGLLDIFYTNPYQHCTNAELYDTLKGKIFGSAA
ncbi:DUF975 family protein [Lachnoclostridium sp. Marseille-P6806]|uniref:DUF975 family protein n=1 Tax=Lachnoclostridium sp. Marseille-P6806 TaxID=2364793 RepID=UPI0013EF35D3|nr:DUF975 family protein [Lachnoclostridium sp. Marseille-P6806]